MINFIRAKTFNRYNGAVENALLINRDPYSPYSLLDVSGIGPVKQEVTRSSSAIEAGDFLINTKTAARNILLTLGLRPSYNDGVDFTAVRRDTYSVFTPGQELTLEFDVRGMGLMTIQGVVESNEPNIFSADPQVIISIICAHPYFRDSVGLRTFTFPPGTNVINMPYEGVRDNGLAPVGFILSKVLNSDRNTTVALTADGVPDGYLSISGGYQFLANDLLEISTLRGNKYARRKRSGDWMDLLSYFRGDMTASKLYQGNNVFRFLPSSATVNMPKISYYAEYVGL